MCYQPVKVVPKRYYSTYQLKGQIKQSALYDTAIYNSENKYAFYPCGKCYECRESQIEAWSIRWKEHIKDSIEGSNYLITLTYRDQDLKFLNKRSTLDYTDVQKFLKRLRKHQEKYAKKNNIINPKITYHGCGEYGTKNTKRPHYHLLISNLILPKEQIESIWSHGTIDIGDKVNDQTIKYVLKYTLKSCLEKEKKQRVTNEKDEFIYNIYTTGKNKGRVCSKTFCSKGIGKNFLTPKIQKFYEENPNANYLWHDEKGYKQKPLPRYYKELIFNPNLIIDGKIARDDHHRPIKKYNPLSEDFENTPRYKRLLVAYKNEQKVINQTLERMQIHGYDNYLTMVRVEKQEKIRIYEQTLRKRQALQEGLNHAHGALLI